MNNIFSTIKTVVLVSLITSVGYAGKSLHNPDFIRQLANPLTYKFNKNFTESICGKNNLQDVNDYDGSRGEPVEFVSKYEQAVGAMAYGTIPNTSKYCSGTLISEDLFLTASHCVDTSVLSEYVVFNYEKLRGSTALAKQEHFKITAVVEKALGGLDYAIIKVDGKPGLKYGFQKVNVKEVQNGNMLTVIQHPSGKPKMVDVGHRSGTRDSNYMTYADLDTEPGSSGSGVLDENGYVVGVHTNGGCTSTDGENAAVQMTEIGKVSKVIQSLAN